MVAQAVAGAVAPVVVQSATSEDGLINKAFKVIMIAAVLAIGLLIVYAISLLSGLVDLGEVSILQSGLNLVGLGNINPLAFGPVSLLGYGITALGALAIRR